MKIPFPTFVHEDALWKKDFLVVGIDEVGRGAFAGPFTIGAVVFDPKMSMDKRKLIENLGIHDSKKLTSKKREQLAPIIVANSLHTCFANIPIKTINSVGIGKSTEIGVRKIVKELMLRFDSKNLFLLIDAFSIKNIPHIGLKNQMPIKFGDSVSISIAAASIVAKVHRDSLMTELSKSYPHYNWQKNKGYGTGDHRRALQIHGLCKEHRVEFVKKTLKSHSSNLDA